MPITKSAKKARRQNTAKKLRNLQRKDTLKTLLKQAKKLIDQKKSAEAKELLPQLYQALDKAVKRNIINKNTAARKKSGFAKLIQKTALSTK